MRMSHQGALAAILFGLFGQTAQAQLHPERRGIGAVSLPTVKAAAGLKPMAVLAQPIDPRRSLFVTDQRIVSEFRFEEVMATLAAQSPDKQLTKEALFRQWWDTANPSPGLGLGPNCDAQKDAAGAATLNGFAYQCPRKEGGEANSSPFTGPFESQYSAIALSNRFDLAGLPATGATDCGEYRIVFARNSGISNPLNRNLLIFEAVLPNPAPNGKDLSGCRPVAEFWAALTGVADQKERARRLKDFYFKGLPGFPPVIKAAHYGNATPQAKGQVRTNQFMQFEWMLREFVLETRDNKLVFNPVTVKSNPAPLLFDENAQHAKGADFRKALPEQTAALAVNDINTFNMGTLSPLFDSGDSEVATAASYVEKFKSSPNLKKAIQGKLGTSKLTPEHIVTRAQALSCAGCHDLSNNAELGGGLGKWPASLRFAHQSEAAREPSPDGGERFKISDALTKVFLPHRQRVLQKFLAFDM